MVKMSLLVKVKSNRHCKNAVAAPWTEAPLAIALVEGMNRRQIAQPYCVFPSGLFSAAAISSHEGARQRFS